MGQNNAKYLTGNYSFTNYGVTQGLVESTVVEFFQDSKGYLWIGTHGGVSRFDGKNFTNYTEKEGLAGGGVYGITQDTLGNMWFGTMTGLSRFDGEAFFNYGKENGISNPQFWDALLTKKKELLLASGGGLYKVKIKNIERNEIAFEHVFFKELDIRDNIIRDIAEDENGILWLGSETCGLKYDPTSGMTEKFFNITLLNGLCIGKDNSIWIGGWGPDDVFNYKNNTLKSMVKTESFPIPFLADSRGNIWVGTWDNGLFKYDGKEWTVFTVKNGLPINSIWSLFEDKEGNIWVGTFGGGVSKFTGEKIVHLTASNGLVNNVVTDIMQDTAQNLWFATDEGISNFNPHRVSNTDNGFINYSNYTNGVAPSKITSIYMDFSGTLFFTSYNGGLGGKYENGSMQNIENGGWCSLIDNDGVLWKGGEFEGGLFRSHENKDSLYAIKKKRKDIHRTISLYQDSKKNMWVGSLGGGFNIYNGKTYINYSKEEGFSANPGTATLEDESGNIWTGTGGDGVLKCSYTNDKIKILDSIKMNDGLSSDNIAFLIFDKNKNLWIGTDKGINIFYLKEYLQTGKKKIKSFGLSDGLKSLECRGGNYLDNDGMLWFGTSEGAVRFNPYDTISKNIPPDIHITDVKLSMEKVNWKTLTEEIDKFTGLPINPELSYQNNHLTFEFTGISLAVPEAIRYSYFLEGAETKWSPPVADTKVTFANLSHGTYTFKVKAITHNGIWSNAPASFEFAILPPWWKTKWFYAFSITVIILSVVAFIRYRERKLKIEKAILEEKVRQRTKVIEEQKAEIEEKNKEITDSIKYAQKIQKAIMPADELIKELFPDSFLLFMPKDIVSGDFYWAAKVVGTRLLSGSQTVFLVADCTGHGVPGAFMSMLCNALLNETVNEKGINRPADVFDNVRKGIVNTLKQTGERGTQKDGMDAVLCVFNPSTRWLECSCANNSLYIMSRTQNQLRDNETVIEPSVSVSDMHLFEIKADRQPVGYHSSGSAPFTNHRISLHPDDTVYLISDGLQDQFGGPKGKKFMVKRLKELLIDLCAKPMVEQKNILENTIKSWCSFTDVSGNNYEQVDDITVAGVRV